MLQEGRHRGGIALQLLLEMAVFQELVEQLEDRHHQEQYGGGLAEVPVVFRLVLSQRILVGYPQGDHHVEVDGELRGAEQHQRLAIAGRCEEGADDEDQEPGGRHGDVYLVRGRVARCRGGEAVCQVAPAGLVARQ